MISKKLKVFLASLFALSLGVSISSASLLAKEAEPVAAYRFEEEESLEEPISSEEPTSEEEVAAAPEETSSEETSEATSGEESSTEVEEKTSGGAPTLKQILGALKNTFRDAWNDLIKHIKGWLKR